MEPTKDNSLCSIKVAGDEDAKLAQKSGTCTLYSVVPTGMHGSTFIFWANLTPLSPERRPSALRSRRVSVCVCTGAPRASDNLSRCT
jgi:hypothetical protein